MGLGTLIKDAMTMSARPAASSIMVPGGTPVVASGCAWSALSVPQTTPCNFQPGPEPEYGHPCGAQEILELISWSLRTRGLNYGHHPYTSISFLLKVLLLPVAAHHRQPPFSCRSHALTLRCSHGRLGRASSRGGSGRRAATRLPATCRRRRCTPACCAAAASPRKHWSCRGRCHCAARAASPTTSFAAGSGSRRGV